MPYHTQDKLRKINSIQFLMLSRPVTRREQGVKPPRKFFASLEKYVGHSLKLLDII